MKNVFAGGRLMGSQKQKDSTGQANLVPGIKSTGEKEARHRF